MWVRFNYDFEGSKQYDVVWSEDDNAAQKLIDAGHVVRCTGPDGVAFAEAAPEEVQEQLRQEALKKVKPSKKVK